MTTPPDPNNPQYPAPPGGYPPPPPSPGDWTGQYPSYPNVPPPPGYPAPAPGGAQPAGGYGYPPGPGYLPPPAYPQGAGYPGFYPPPPAPYADWLRRLGAVIIDSLIVAVPLLALFLIAGLLSAGNLHCTTDQFGTTRCTGSPNPASIVLYIIGWLTAIGLGLYLCYREGTTGQTPGKRLVGIRLVRERDYQVLGFGMAFVRRIAHILDSLPCYLGWLWPLWDAKRQTFADKVMGSVVLRG